MALKTLKELRDNVASTIRDTQIGTLLDSYINLTLLEIWNYHPWTFARRKTTFSTVATQEDYFLDEEVDRLLVVRQRTTRRKLTYVPDQLFYQYIPSPEDMASGTPTYYRLSVETGFLAQNTSAEKLTVESTSASDTSAFKVIISGFDSTYGLRVDESLSLNGTTAVTSTSTYAISGLLQCSKSAATTGTILIKGATSGTTFSRISPEESAPRYKTISLYPIPSSAITIYLEYIERCRLLVNDADVPQLDHKWLWVIREGVLAKAWEYKSNEELFSAHSNLFAKGLQQMRQQDEGNPDYVPVLDIRWHGSVVGIRQVSPALTTAVPNYALG